MSDKNKIKIKCTADSAHIVAGILLWILMLNAMNIQAQVFEGLSYPFEMKHAAINDQVSIAYADEGKGDVILFIHGLGSYAPSWKKNVEALKKTNRCIVVDLAGYGKSSKQKYQADMTFHANNLLALMEHLKIKKYSIAGHSMGAQIAVHMTLQNPTPIQKLILLAPAGIETFTEENKKVFAMVTPESLMMVGSEQYMKNLKINFFNFPEDAQFMFDDRMAFSKDEKFADYCHVVVQGIQGMLNQPVFNRLHEIKQPVLIIYGKEDALIPNRYLHPTLTTEQIAISAEQAFANATRIMIDKAGHFVMFEQAAIVNEKILHFLKTSKLN